MTRRGQAGFSLPLQNREGRTHTGVQVSGICTSLFSTTFAYRLPDIVFTGCLFEPGENWCGILERVISAWRVVLLCVVAKAMQQHTDCLLFPFTIWVSIVSVPDKYTHEDKCLAIFHAYFYSWFSISSLNWKPDPAPHLTQPPFPYSHLFCQDQWQIHYVRIWGGRLSTLQGLETWGYLGFLDGMPPSVFSSERTAD